MLNYFDIVKNTLTYDIEINKANSNKYIYSNMRLFDAARHPDKLSDIIDDIEYARSNTNLNIDELCIIFTYMHKYTNNHTAINRELKKIALIINPEHTVHMIKDLIANLIYIITIEQNEFFITNYNRPNFHTKSIEFNSTSSSIAINDMKTNKIILLYNKSKDKIKKICKDLNENEIEVLYKYIEYIRPLFNNKPVTKLINFTSKVLKYKGKQIPIENIPIEDVEVYGENIISMNHDIYATHRNIDTFEMEDDEVIETKISQCKILIPKPQKDCLFIVGNGLSFDYARYVLKRDDILLPIYKNNGIDSDEVDYFWKSN